MSEPMYDWVREIFSWMLPEIEKLTASTPDAEAKAKAWFERYLEELQMHTSEQGRSIGRHITPQSMKKHVVAARNAIREIDPNHFALAHVGYDEATWARLNQEIFDRVEKRNQEMQFLSDPDAIVAKATSLLQNYEDWPKIAVGLAVVTGRRISELLSVESDFRHVSAYSLLFKGQRKTGNAKDFAYEIVTLAPVSAVLPAWRRLREVLGTEVMTPQKINSRYGEKVNGAARTEFEGLVPRRTGKDELYTHLYRAVYATIAVHWFCPPRVNPTMFKAEIQGHTQITGADSEEKRRSYASQRNYDDYRIADATGENIDGRQGIKLGKLPGLEVITVFRSPQDPRVMPEETTLRTGTFLAEPGPAATPTPAPVEPMDTTTVVKPARKPARKKEETPVCRKMYRSDIDRLKALRLDEKEGQADTLSRVLDEHARLIAGEAEAKQMIERLSGQLATEKSQSESVQSQLSTERSHLQELQSVIRILEASGQTAERQGEAIPPQVFTSLKRIMREVDDLGEAATIPEIEARLEALFTLASGVVNCLFGGTSVPPLLQRSTTVPVPAAQPTETQAEPSSVVSAALPAATEPTSGPATEPPVEHAPTGEPKSTALEAGEPIATETPAPAGGADSSKPGANATGKLHRTGITAQADDKVYQAVKKIMAHNDAQTEREKKWVITPSLIERGLRNFRDVVNRFFAAHGEEVTAHNAKHALGKGHNIGHGRAGRKIEEIIAAAI